MEYNIKTIKNYGIAEKVNVKPPKQISTDVSCQTRIRSCFRVIKRHFDDTFYSLRDILLLS